MEAKLHQTEGSSVRGEALRPDTLLAGRHNGEMTAKDLPAYNGFLVPALRAVRELGGSASISEIVETVVQGEGFTEPGSTDE